MNVKESTEKYGEDDIVDWFPKNDSPDALIEFASYTPKNKTEMSVKMRTRMRISR